MTEAVLFDFNGVLVDDEAQHCEALQAVLREEGITLSRDEYYSDYLGFDDRTGFVQAYRLANRTLTTENLNRLVEAKTRVYQRFIDASLKIVAGAAEFVRAAAERFRLAVVTGALRREVEAALSRTGFADHFEVVVTADEVANCKPDPSGYLTAHAALNRRQPVAITDCVAIEDSLPGLAAARAAGMACVMIATNYSSRVLKKGGAPIVWDSFVSHTPAELADL